MSTLHSQFYMIYQPIKQVNCSKKAEGKSSERHYEALLRSVETNRFPLKDFPSLIQDEESNACFLDWVVPQFIEQLEQHPDVVLSINFDVDQWAYPSTFEAVEKLLPYKEQIIIEVTEHQPRFNHSIMKIYGEILKEVSQRGFKIAVDDIGQGINTFPFFLKYLRYFSRVKVAVYDKRCFLKPRFYLLTNKVLKWFGRPQMEIVVERVETEEMSRRLKAVGICLQQGRLFGMGERHVKAEEALT